MTAASTISMDLLPGVTLTDTLENCLYITYYFLFVKSSYITKDKLCAKFCKIHIEVLF